VVQGPGHGDAMKGGLGGVNQTPGEQKGSGPQRNGGPHTTGRGGGGGGGSMKNCITDRGTKYSLLARGSFWNGPG